MHGYVLLAAAIVINVVVDLLGGTTWYGYIACITDQGLVQASLSMPVWEILFLFVIYPTCLGMVIHGLRERG